MCSFRNSNNIFNIRTLLFIILLLSFELCSPQNLRDDFSVDPVSDMLVTVEKDNYQSDSAKDTCRLSELLCDTGQCISLDKYCNGEDDCGDKSDEPKSCSRKLYLYYFF